MARHSRDMSTAAGAATGTVVAGSTGFCRAATVSERQWRHLLGVLTAQGERSDEACWPEMASTLGLTRLQRALVDARPRTQLPLDVCRPPHNRGPFGSA